MNVQLIYQGKDITNDVDVKKADIIDNAGGIADSLVILFDDPKGVWSQWQPRKDDRVELCQDGLCSGLTYVDELEQTRGIFILQSLSIPQEAKTAHTKSWEKICFIELARGIAGKYGFQLKTYGIENYYYDRVDQFEQADFEFLAWRCLLEGYMLKVNGQSVIIYAEQYMEKQSPVRAIYQGQFDGEYSFKSRSTEIFNACKITYGGINAEFLSDTNGPILSINNLYIANQSEADRYTKNLLRAKNKNENSGYCTIALDTGITAGNMVEIADVGFGDGTYFVSSAVHKLVDKKTFLRLRKPLEGY